MYKISPMVLLGALALALPACSTAGSVPVRGNAVQTAALDGDWSGTAEDEADKVVSRIAFSFRSGRHTGNGKVTLLAADGTEAAVAIEFVQAGDGYVEGQLTPYQHPECACLVNTEFKGALMGDYIEGQFTTVAQEGAFRKVGEWSVSRN